jgi:iron(III) transport system ATP-binding protein
VLLAARSEPTGRLATELGAVDCSHAAGSPNCELLLRPDDLVLDDLGPIRARVVDRAFRGAEYLYTLELQSGHRVFAFGASHHARDVGAEVRLRLEPHHVVVFEALDSRSPG